MRLALVVLFFVVLHFALRPSPAVDPVSEAAQDSTSQPAQAEGQAPQPPLPPAAVTGTAPAPADAGEEAQVDPPLRSGEAERPGEQRTSQHGPLKRVDIEAGIQKELTRLACLTGRPERKWGSRSRSALRRFVSRAKPKDGSTPSEALLHFMRDYPANYCKTCARPGQASCRIDGRGRRKSEGETPPSGKADAEGATAGKTAERSLAGEKTLSEKVISERPVPEASYLPPWMIEDGEVAKLQDKVRTDVIAHTSPAISPPEAVRPRRPKRVVRQPRRPRFRSAREFNPPSLNGWPRGY
jgi:hypothetical protein